MSEEISRVSQQSLPSYYDSYRLSRSEEYKRETIYYCKQLECGSGSGYKYTVIPILKELIIPAGTIYEFKRILKTIFFIYDVIEVEIDRFIVWARIWSDTPTVTSNYMIYREDRTPAHPTTIARADQIMISTVSTLLENIKQIERIDYQIGEYIPYVITLSV